jgi:hypothetical protein
MQYQYHWRFELLGTRGEWCTYSRRYKSEAAALAAGRREQARNVGLGFAVTAVRAVNVGA